MFTYIIILRKLQYLEEMKSKSIRIIISDVYEEAARDMMCQAYKLEMTAMQSYVWFLPAWLSPKWYDTDSINKESGTDEIPCTTKEMLQVLLQMYVFCRIHYCNELIVLLMHNLEIHY